MSQARLLVEDLKTHHLGPCSLTIAPGECVCLTGPSGSGKTLLLRAIADLDIHEGQVTLEDTDCNDMPAPQWRKNVSLVPAESQWWTDTVGQHFVTKDCPYLEELGFEQAVFDWQVSRLSTGEKQRLALARALMNLPRVLLLDEPTASLDQKNTRVVEHLVKNYCKEAGASVLWVSHDPDQASRVCDRQYLLSPSQAQLSGLKEVTLLEASR